MFYVGLPLLDWCGLSLDGIKHGRLWQLITFQFMHSVPWPWHLLGNCLGLYFFGRSIEEALGRGRFLRLYFACGLLGGVLQLATTLILPGHTDLPVVGASAVRLRSSRRVRNTVSNEGSDGLRRGVSHHNPRPVSVLVRISTRCVWHPGAVPKTSPTRPTWEECWPRSGSSVGRTNG